MTQYLKLAIPIGQYFSTVLQPNYQDYIPIGGTFSMPGYGINQYGYLPSLPAGLTFDEQTSELYGTIPGTIPPILPPEQNFGDFMVITSIGSYNIMTFTIVNIYYYYPESMRS
jgi:hypothetical protein